MDVNLFKYYMAKAGKTTNDVAAKLGVHPATLHRKLTGESDFYRNEIVIISDYLNLDTDAVTRIFFTD